MSEIKYEFNQLFQTKLVSQLLLDSGFLLNYRDAIEPTYFEHQDLTLIVRILFEYVDRYRTHPDRFTMYALIQERTSLDKSVTHDDLGRIFNLLEECYNLSLDSEDYLKDLILPFGKSQKFKLFLLESVPLLGEFAKHESLLYTKFNSVFSLGAGTNDASSDFYQSYKDLSKRLRESEADPSQGRIPTGIGGLDVHLKGGLGVGELGFVEALPGVGKSNALVNFAVGAALNQKNVLIISNELKVLDWEIRLAARLSGIPQDDLHTNTGENALSSVMSNNPYLGKFMKIYYYPPFRLKPEGLRSLVAHIQQVQGEKVDLIILDYFNRMGGIDPNNPWNTESAVIKGLITVLSETNTRCWTATQPNTLDRNIETLDMSHSGGSKSKVHDADIVMSLNQSRAQSDNNEANIFISKARRGVSEQNVKIHYDKAKCLMLDWNLYYEVINSNNNTR